MVHRDGRIEEASRSNARIASRTTTATRMPVTAQLLPAGQIFWTAAGQIVAAENSVHMAAFAPGSAQSSRTGPSTHDSTGKLSRQRP